MIDIFEFIGKLNLGPESTILEIGAHMGFDTEKIYAAANQPKMFCFEPDHRNTKILTERGIDKIATVIEKAVADKSEKKMFYLSTGDIPTSTGNDYYDLNEWTASSSLRTFKEHTQIFPWCQIKEAVIIDAITLDDFAEEHKVNDVSFIWMDVQGAEDLVFQGGQELLQRTEFIFTEYSKAELYRGQKGLEDIISILPGEWKIVGYDASGLNVLLENVNYRSKQIGTTGIWNTKNMNEHVFDKGLANAVVNLMTSKKCSNMYDFGCGHGKYVKFLSTRGIDIKGFDGNPFTKEIAGDEFEILDLSSPFTLPPVDWVLCLEVGEHIPKEFESTLIDNIVNHASVGIILSWGIPDQGGFGHVNCVTNEYVIDIFNSKGFTVMTETQNLLRWSANSDWFKNTIMVFERTAVQPVEIVEIETEEQ